jgi:hypothetical protein
MISLKRTEADDESQKFTEIADDGQEDTSRTDLDKSNQKDDLIHRKFSVVHVGSLDGENFFNSNPGMLGALKEIENVRKRVKEKGGIGVAILLVRCGPIVQVRFLTQRIQSICGLVIPPSFHFDYCYILFCFHRCFLSACLLKLIWIWFRVKKIGGRYLTKQSKLVSLGNRVLEEALLHVNPFFTFESFSALNSFISVNVY